MGGIDILGHVPVLKVCRKKFYISQLEFDLRLLRRQEISDTDRNDDVNDDNTYVVHLFKCSPYIVTSIEASS